MSAKPSRKATKQDSSLTFLLGHLVKDPVLTKKGNNLLASVGFPLLSCEKNKWFYLEPRSSSQHTAGDCGYPLSGPRVSGRGSTDISVPILRWY